ncbi:MAG: cupin domain-containing protein [Phycisphaeraceae bacterium]|nr:cupin domain-containing protein [Phycisphaerales bacterium]MCB9861212.1 cupin domain-containing protein [Phycisphaeraceae bacterium]
MDIRNLDEVTMNPVQMDGANGVRMAIMVGRDDGAPHFAMRKFEVEPGGNTPRHQHDYEHEVIILGGSGTVLLHGEDRTLKAGDVLYVPADSEHQFRADQGTSLEFICLVPVERNCGGDTPGS